jgi:mono/diheme cytochrome c family protein
MEIRGTRRSARVRRGRATGGPLLAALAVAALVGCSAESDAPEAAAPGAGAPAATGTTPAEPPADPGRLAARGEQVYRTNCLACHAMDPSEAGAVGPALAGSSLELLRAKVLRNEYPPGYTPKRETRAMVPLPHLEPDLPALAAYLEQAAD